MTIKDWKEIGAVAVITATVTVGILSTRPGMSVDPVPTVTPSIQTAVVGPLMVSASAHADAVSGSVKATVHIANPTKDAQEGKLKVVLTQVTFGGSPASRVMSPSDYKTIQIGSNTVKRSVSANGSVDVVVSFKIPHGETKTIISPSYRIDVENNGKPSPLGWATFDAQPVKPSSNVQSASNDRP